MARRARLKIDGYPLHIIQRGNNKSVCFREERDYAIYLRLLDEYSALYACPVHAYVLMTNHTHLLLSPRHVEAASQLMKHLGQRFVQYVNRRYDRSGTLFEGRFKSCIVDTDGYLLCCQRYIEMNPVRAGMVDHPSRYPWSSYRTNAEGRRSSLIVRHPLYLDLGSDEEQRRQRYRALFDDGIKPAELERIRGAVNTGTALGNDGFVASLDDSVRQRASRRKPGRPRKRERSA